MPNFSSATLFSVELILMYYRDTDEEIHHSGYSSIWRSEQNALSVFIGRTEDVSRHDRYCASLPHQLPDHCFDIGST